MVKIGKFGKPCAMQDNAYRELWNPLAYIDFVIFKLYGYSVATNMDAVWVFE